MTEDEARQVLLLQSRETGAAPLPHWSAEDRAWATRQAVATAGAEATPERFVLARAAVALQRLLPRDASAQRWLQRRGWHGAWVGLALALAFIAGLAADQLGPPQRVNLLAPAVWAVVAWNLVVYGMLMLPRPAFGLRAALARLGLKGDGSAAALWAEHAAPLLARRTALVLHTAAAGLALGLMAGLYLRGLVLDYRAGWQSTFLEAPQVQQLLSALLAPAAALSGIAVPEVAPLRIGPGGNASASAAPWIHLYAATLALFVLLPRTLLALRAGLGAGALARHFPLALDTPYFEALHPLMRPGLAPQLRLLWPASNPALALLGLHVEAVGEPLVLLASPEGDELMLQPEPSGLALAAAPAAVPWWTPWRRAEPDARPALRGSIDAVLWVNAPGQPRPPWIATLGRPLIVLVDGDEAEAAEPGAIGLGAMAEGWLPQGRLFTALAEALPGDPRVPRLRAAWEASQRARIDATAAELAATLAQIACDREPVDDAGVLRRAAETETARRALFARLEAELRAHTQRLATVLGLPELPPAAHGLPAEGAALRRRIGEGRAALVGGVLSGALAGLKADLLSGGLTMGAGAVAGGLIGALGAAGAARGANVVRGTDKSLVGWTDEALAPLAEALLLRALLAGWGVSNGLSEASLLPRVHAAFEQRRAELHLHWAQRPRGPEITTYRPTLAAALQPPLAAAIEQLLAARG